jgi:hypothetical protein
VTAVFDKYQHKNKAHVQNTKWVVRFEIWTLVHAEDAVSASGMSLPFDDLPDMAW